MTLIVGLTGGIASGKSTISAYFQSLNILVLDADIEARLAVEKGEPAYHKIVAYFGKGILQENGAINRKKLGEIIFADEKERMVLNRIVHPDVNRRIKEKQEQAIAKGEQVVIVDIPLLFENHLEKTVDKIIVVYVDKKTQLQRLMARNQLTSEEALMRIQSQMPLEEKKAQANEVINNNQSIEEAKKQAKEILYKWNVLKEGN